MKKDNFDTIFNNPYINTEYKEESPSSPPENVKVIIENPKEAEKNTTIFYNKPKKEKKMIYIKVSSSQKLERIAKKYNLSISEILDLMVENQEY